MKQLVNYWCLFYIAITIFFATTGFFLPDDGYLGLITPCHLYIGLVFGSMTILFLCDYFSRTKTLNLIFKLVSSKHSIIAGGWYRNTNSFLSVFHKSNMSMLCSDKNNQQLLMASLQNNEIYFENIPMTPTCSVVNSQGARETFQLIEFKKADKKIYFLPCDAHFRLNFKSLDDLARELNQRASMTTEGSTLDTRQ